MEQTKIFNYFLNVCSSLYMYRYVSIQWHHWTWSMESMAGHRCFFKSDSYYGTSYSAEENGAFLLII